MQNLHYTQKSKEDLKKIDFLTQKRIVKKLGFFLDFWNPLYFAEKLTNSMYGEYRFRIWDYRVLFDVDREGKIIIIAVIWYRKEIYK